MSRFPTRSLRQAPADDLPWVIAVIALSTVARLIFAAGVDYGIDEAYAVAVARSFQWSFYDHPPLAFWTVGLFEALFGSQAPHWLMRLPFVLGFSVTLWLIYDLTRRLFDSRAGLWAIIMIAVAPFFFASAGSWLVPDGPLDLFLALTAVLLARILFADLPPEETAEGWLFTGLAFGLAALSKYHAFLFGFGGAVFILATRHRALLARPAPWIAVGLALAIFSPVILWNAGNGWISLAFQSGRAQTGSGLFPAHLAQSLAGQAAYLLPWTFILLIFVLIRVVFGRPGWLAPAVIWPDPRTARQSSPREKALFLVSLGLVPILGFTLAPLFGNRGLPHWQMPGWLFIFPLFGVLLAHAERQSARWPMRLATISAGLTGSLALTMLIGLNASGVATLLLDTPGLLDGRAVLKPLVTEATDWKGLRAALADRNIPLDTGQFVVALRWHEGARLAAELGAKTDVAVFNKDARGFAFLTDQTKMLGRDAVIIGDWQPMMLVDEELRPYFRNIDRPQLLTLMVAGGIPRTLSVAVAHELIRPFPLAYGATTPAPRP